MHEAIQGPQMGEQSLTKKEKKNQTPREVKRDLPNELSKEANIEE